MNDGTPYGMDGDHCPWCGCDWKEPHSEWCDTLQPGWVDPRDWA